MLQRLVQKNIELDNLVTTGVGTVIDLEGAERFSVQAVIDVNTPAAITFPFSDVDVTANTMTEAGHGLTTGLKGQFTTSGGLPTGISGATDYFVIVVDANTFKVATNLSNALAGTPVDITAQGTGNHTFTPTAVAGGAVKLLKSNKPEVLVSGYTYVAADWTDVAAATAVTADATVWFEVSAPSYLAALLHYTLTAGRLSSDNYLLIKGNS